LLAAAVFGVRSQLLGSFFEVVEPSFFRKSAGDGWPGIIAKFNHSDEMVLGTTHSGSLRLEQDAQGLRYEVDLPETRCDVGELVEHGDVHSSSFAFQCYDDTWLNDGGTPVRHLRSGRLLDVSPVTSPADTATSVSLRSLAAFVDEPVEDIAALDQKQLRKLFTNNTEPHRGLSGAQARSKLIRLRYPEKPALTGFQAQLEAYRRRWPSGTLNAEVLGKPV
jgi:HK97 family phage prohead protease